MVDRRSLIAGVGGVLLALSFASRAQQLGRPLRIGRLAVGSPEGAMALIQAHDEALREHGLVEGRNVEVVTRWARGSLDALPALAAELVALPVDLILAGNNTAIAAAQRATSTIPIVMVLAVDPVRNGFIESLARPGRNITGLTNDSGQSMHGKMLGMLNEMVPAASAIGVLAQQGLGYDRKAVDQAAQLLQLRLHYAPEVRQPEEIELGFEAMRRAGVQAVYVIGGAYIYQRRQAVAELSLRHRLPGMFFSSDYVRAGCLISYGTDLRAQNQRAAWYVARILSGVKPADLPVEQPARFEMAINAKTAKALGLTIPQRLLLRADVVVE